ncbi:kynurenine aminotransferase-like [Oppia nitens]|uniref:kynurenine aminotransferase-like n=1 Tax=Oppia nitens TaxID=1686743 RepID=UPI0023DA352F|nr:kynurenine aminotransferase-like [Oppia nitens]
MAIQSSTDFDFDDIFYQDNELNLSIGHADYEIYPKEIIEFMTDIMQNGNTSLHQYTNNDGLPRLKSILQKIYTYLLGEHVQIVDKNIQITMASSAAIYCSLKALVNSGDHVIIIDPSYPFYARIVENIGGVAKHYPMTYDPIDNKWILDVMELEQLFSPMTKAIIINTPHNPTGRVITESELLSIANLCRKYNVIAICDEVYEWLVYEPKKHFKFASIPGMFDRSVTIGSLSKWFHVTGWRLGWALTGNSKLMADIYLNHMCMVITSSTPIQEATARMLELEYTKLIATGSDGVCMSGSPAIDDSQRSMYWTKTCRQLQAKRDQLANILQDFGLKPLTTDAGYYIVADCLDLCRRLDLSDYVVGAGSGSGGQQQSSIKPYTMVLAFIRWLSSHVPVLSMHSVESNRCTNTGRLAPFYIRDILCKDCSRIPIRPVGLRCCRSGIWCDTCAQTGTTSEPIPCLCYVETVPKLPPTADTVDPKIKRILDTAV